MGTKNGTKKCQTGASRLLLHAHKRTESAASNSCFRLLFYAFLSVGIASLLILFLLRAFRTSPPLNSTHHLWLPNIYLNAKCHTHAIVENPINLQLSSAPEPAPDRRSSELQEADRAFKESLHNANEEDDADDLYPDIYHNASSFRLSYQAMEMTFRIYVYKDGHKPLIHQGPTTGIYASEGLFIDTMEKGNRFITKDPAKASMFFLPYSLKQMVSHLYDSHARSMKIITRHITNYVKHIAAKHPYWNRTQGNDHFFVSCHDWAVHTLRDHKQLEKNVVKVICNADKANGFNVERDVSLPEIIVKSKTIHYQNLGGLRPSERPFLAFFAGQMHGSLRPEIVRHWRDRDPSMKVFEVLPPSISKNTSYVQHMKMSKYCLCPRGFDVNSPRLVEAIYYDCVPVVISDNYVFPFQDVLDWKKLAIQIPETDVPRLKQILENVPVEFYESIQQKLRFARRHFLWHRKPKKYDVFNMIIHSLWTRQIQGSAPHWR